jgi:predicted chitinase
MSHFLEQIGAETDRLVTLKEIPCYKESGIRANFGFSKYCDLFEGYDCVDYSAYATATETVQCTQGTPTTTEAIKAKYICTAALFDYVYSCSARKPGSPGDLGNGSPASKDGSTFLGRGFIQLTGKWNYEQLSKAWNADPENANNKKYFHKHTSEGGNIDELETNLDVAMKASMYYWQMKKTNPKSDAGISNSDIDNVGYTVNGTNPPNDYERDVTLLINRFNFKQISNDGLKNTILFSTIHINK